jgi:transposase InsO family protein
MTISGVLVTFLIDSGASRSLMNSEVYSKFRIAQLPPTMVRLETLTGEEIETEGQIQLPLDQVGYQDFIVIPGMDNEAILGDDFLSRFQADILYGPRTVNVKGREFPFVMSEMGFVPQIGKVTEIMDTPSWLTDVVEGHTVFRNELGFCSQAPPCKIITEGHPIRQRPYRQALTKRQVVETEIEKMLEQGVIRPSSSPWSSPITLTPKKDGSTRFCVDYRKVNAITVKDGFPIPNIQDIFDTLGGSVYFSTLDLRSGYWQLPLDEESIPKSAFVCHKGQYEFTRLAFGLTSAPSQFQRVMNNVLSEHLGKICLCYIDDIVIFSRTQDEHRAHVETILNTIAKAGLTLKGSKCHFGQTKVELLGYTISGEGISPQEGKSEAIKSIPEPASVKEVRSFLGCAGYYRQCLQNFAEMAAPLVALTRKGELFRFGESERTAFESLKEALCSDQVMAYPDASKPYKLYTDASNYCIGGILVQETDGIERPIQYISKQLSEGQKKWSAIEREAFAVIYALQKLRPYLWGAQFTVYTDHKPLLSLFKAEIKNTRVQRWAMLISEFGCKIEYRKGKTLVRADMLSRIRVETVQEIVEELNCGQEQEMQFPTQWAKAQELVNDEYVIMEGQLYSVIPPFIGAEQYPRLMLPEQYRSRAIDMSHEETGHRGLLSVMRRLHHTCVWPGMRKDVLNHIGQCVHCQVNRRAPRPVPLEKPPTPMRPFECVGIDLVGPFLPSPQGNKYLLTCIDHLTGWAEAYAIPNKTSHHVWQALYTRFIPQHGAPDIILSDQGQEFNSNEIRANFRQANIKHKRSSPYHPQGNGICERFNKTLKETLRKLVNNDTGAWEDRLAEALIAYRISHHSSKGNSPFYLLYGREPGIPCSPGWESVTSDNRLGKMAEALRYAYKQTEKVKDQNKRLYDRKTADRVIEVGDYVTLTHQNPVTMTSLRDAAYRVVRVRGKVVGCQALEPQAGQPLIRYLSKDRVRLVPELQYGLLNPRVNRYTGPSDARTLTQIDLQPEYETAPAQNPTSIHIRRKRPASSIPTPAEAKKQRIACVRQVKQWIRVFA